MDWTRKAPSTEYFENMLFEELLKLDPQKPTGLKMKAKA
jgi:hypothetical protein